MTLPAGSVSDCALFVLLLLGLGFGILAWRNPLWLVDQQIDARLRLHGVHSEFVTVNGYKMHYLVGGTGRPLVLVHGLGSRAAGLGQPDTAAHRRWPSRVCRGFVGVWSVPRSPGMRATPSRSRQRWSRAFSIASTCSRWIWPVGPWADGSRCGLRCSSRSASGVWCCWIARVCALSWASIPLCFSRPRRRILAALEELLVPHPRPLPGFLAMAMLRRGDHVGWVVRRSVQSMMTGEDLVDGKLGRADHAGAYRLGRPGPADPALGRLSAALGDTPVGARCVRRLRASCARAVRQPGRAERGGFSECTAGTDGDGAADPEHRQQRQRHIAGQCIAGPFQT